MMHGSYYDSYVVMQFWFRIHEIMKCTFCSRADNAVTVVYKPPNIRHSLERQWK